MSDFLGKFSKKEYQDDTTANKPSTKNKIDITDSAPTPPPRRSTESYEKDTGYAKKKKIKIGIAIGTTAVVLIAIILIFLGMNTVTMGQFENSKTIDEMRVWALQNKITLNETFEYSKAADENFILKQSIDSGAKIQKGNTVDVRISKGADPEEKIKLPDFKTMDASQIEKWKDENKANNVTISKEFDDEIEKNKFIKTEFKDKEILPEDYRRKHKLTISVSKGKEVFEKNITVPDFSDKSKEEVKTWAEKEDVHIEFLEQSDDLIDKGMVVAQNILPKEKIAKKDTLIVTLSLGKVVYAPSFYGLDETQAQSTASPNGANATILHYYHDSIEANQLINQSIPAGERVTDTIVLTYSLGRPFISNFVDQPVNTLLDVINEMNQKGANLSYHINYVNGNGSPKGNIISTSENSTFIPTGTVINIDVSNGN